jgi:hypothetical protein
MGRLDVGEEHVAEPQVEPLPVEPIVQLPPNS